MRLIRHDGEYKVIDSINRIAKLTKPILKLNDIFASDWWKGTDDTITTDYLPITDEQGSFKALKHAVAGHILSNDIDLPVPERYVKSYNMNKHLYEG